MTHFRAFPGAGVRWLKRPVQQGVGRLARRWAWALAGTLVGACWGAVWGWDEYEAHEQWRHQVQSLRGASHAVVPDKPMAGRLPAPDAPALVDRLPAQRDAARLWLVLQQGLAQHGLHVQSLRPQAWQPSEPLSSQTVALRMQGHFADGVQAWASLVEAGPVWTLDRLTLTPGAQASQLQWEGVWRVWLRPDAPKPQAWPAFWDLSSRHASTHVDPFVAAPGLAHPAGASEPRPDELAADPQLWPLAHIRLLGVWQQGERLQAVLGAGPHWTVLGPGARVAREAYRVMAVQPDAVAMQAATGQGPVHVLRLERGWQ